MRSYLLSTHRQDITCTLEEDHLVFGEPPRREQYEDIRFIWTHGVPGLKYAGQEAVLSSAACSIAFRHGRKLKLVSRRRGTDRSAAHRQFVADLLRCVSALPNAKIYTGFSWPVWLLWFVLFIPVLGISLFAIIATIYAVASLFTAGRSWSIAEFLLIIVPLAAFASYSSVMFWRVLRREKPRRISSTSVSQAQT